MPLRSAVPIGLTVLSLLAGCTTTDANSAGSPSAATSVPSTALTPSGANPSRSYGNLLVAAADIPIPDLQLKASSVGAETAGAAGEFVSADGTTTITDVISVFGTTNDAGIALTAAEGVAPGQLDAPQTRRLSVGGNAYAGKSGNAFVTIAVFSVGRAFVTLRFQTTAAEAISDTVVDQVVQAQATRIKANLH